MRIAVGLRGCCKRGDVGSRFRLGQRESGDRAASRDRRQVAGSERVRSEQRDRAGAESLHSEGKIGEAIMKAEDLAAEAERAHVERLMLPAKPCRHRWFEKTGIAQELHPRTTGAIDVVMGRAGEVVRGPFD